MIEDCRSILRAFVWTLTIHLRWIVAVPEEFEDLFIRNFLWVEFDFKRFGVLCCVGTDIVVCRILCFSARVADLG